MNKKKKIKLKNEEIKFVYYYINLRQKSVFKSNYNRSTPLCYSVRTYVTKEYSAQNFWEYCVMTPDYQRKTILTLCHD